MARNARDKTIAETRFFYVKADGLVASAVGRVHGPQLSLVSWQPAKINYNLALCVGKQKYLPNILTIVQFHGDLTWLVSLGTALGKQNFLVEKLTLLRRYF
ncbi:MAG: hypothetical protein LBU69_00860 [Deltaproteobacteria bacterium]|nr:hypothetical protein [Deltaproteobacteria bacterium]